MAAVSQRVQSSAASNSGQSSSAPVLEFVCLFSRDLRKKQKRWQDGRIKYHAFNKRVMVYDERGNFVGDTHWREDHDFEEGEELELERGGVIVQTAECVGSRAQDLSELIDKRAQEKVQRQTAAAARHSSPLAPGSAPRPPHPPPGHLQLHSRPLHNVVGTPTGHYGRAMVPSESPYEQRRRHNAGEADPHDEESPRPAKRRKRDIEPPSKNGYAQNLFGATLSLSAVPMSSAPVRHQPKKVLQNSGSYSFPKPSNPGDEDSEVEGQQTTPSDANIPRAKPSRLADSTALFSVPRPAVKLPKVTHAVPKARERPSSFRGNTREEPIVIDLSPSQEESCNTSKQAQNTPDISARSRPLGAFSLQSKSKPNEYRREASKDKTMGGRFDVSLSTESRTRDPVQATGKSITEDATTGSRRLAVDEPSTLVGSSFGSLAEYSRPGKETIGSSEARIELRVKSRKKRGLLMMSENSVPKKPRKPDGPNSAGSPLCLESSPQPLIANVDDGFMDEPIHGPLGRGRPPRKIARKSSGKYDVGAIIEAKAEVHSTHEVPAGCDDEVETHLSEAPPPILGTPKVTGSVKPGKGAPDDHSFDAEPLEDVSADERFSSEEPSEVMSIVDQVKGQIPGARQVVEKRGVGGKARMVVDQDSDESRSDDGPRGMRTASPKPEQPPVTKEKRRSTRATANKAEKVPPPRLVRLSRKGIRSKEVIGLTFDDDGDHKPASFSTAGVQDFNGAKAQQKSKAMENMPSDTPCCQEQNDRAASCNGASGQQPTPQAHEADAVSLVGVEPSRTLPADGLGRRGLCGALPRPREEPPNTCDLPPVVKADNIPSVELKRGTASNSETAVAPADSKDVSTSEEPAGRREGQPQSRPDAHKDEPHLSQQQHTTVLQEAPLAGIEAVAAQAVPRAQPIPRLANPASRGKKAAKASDAAGKMPEAILPAEPPSLPGRQQRSRMPVNNSGNGGEPKPELPGFSKATGGPWSREAHDLFEFTRPQEKAA